MASYNILTWYKTKTCRMVSMLCLTFLFFLAEIVFGYITNSLALIGDSYHMLSDVLALLVGLTSLRMSKKNSSKNTFGWARAEVLGALVNSVFLVALCFTIFIEAIQRLTHAHKIEQVDSMIYVGVAGLVVNILGLILFSGQGRDKRNEVLVDVEVATQQETDDSMDNTGDDVDETSTSAEDNSQSSTDSTMLESVKVVQAGDAADNAGGVVVVEAPSSAEDNSLSSAILSVLSIYTISSSTDTATAQHAHSPKSGDSVDNEGETSTTCENSSLSSTLQSVKVRHKSDDILLSSSQLQLQTPTGPSNDPIAVTKKRKKIKSGTQLNMRAVFLHVLGDALGSVVVIISGILIKFLDADWKYKIDPILSMVLVIIIMCTSIPLLKESAFILMQTVPSHIEVKELARKLLEQVEDVHAVHEFHVWQLAGNRIIATAHINCLGRPDYMRVASQIKTFFHNEGIHSITIQPEFVELDEMASDRVCMLDCGPDKPCHMDTCCARRKNVTRRSDLHTAAQLRQSSEKQQQQQPTSRQHTGITDSPDNDGQFSDIIDNTYTQLHSSCVNIPDNRI